MNGAATIGVEHRELGRGYLHFQGVTESTTGEFSGDDPAVYALLPAGMPESYETALFLDSSDRVYRIEGDHFAYGYEYSILWLTFLDGRDDADPLIFRITDFGKAPS